MDEKENKNKHGTYFYMNIFQKLYIYLLWYNFIQFELLFKKGNLKFLITLFKLSNINKTYLNKKYKFTVI